MQKLEAGYLMLDKFIKLLFLGFYYSHFMYKAPNVQPPTSNVQPQK